MDASPLSLSPEECIRYARHLLLPEVGEAGQLKLKAARVLIVGLGGLGSPVALYLAASGVGTLGLVDADTVDASNMHRQVLYGTDDIGRPKTEAARQRLIGINPDSAYVAHTEKFTAENAECLLGAYDLVIDGSDNFKTHYLINDACVLHNKPLIYAALSRFNGMVSAVLPRQSACYRCLYPAPPPPDFTPNCAEAGVLGVLPGMVGMIQATEAVKLILGIGKTLAGRVLLIDGLNAGFKDIAAARDPACPLCGDQPSIAALHETHPACATRGGGAKDLPEITAEQLKKEMASASPPFLLDVRNRDEFDERRIAGSTLIPLPELDRRFAELDPSRDTVVHCRMGGRSAKAIQFLQSKGFGKLRNLAGGIEAY
jgi:molybdopterin/thiamine biosynthesis adenylyltransferase/rhodanese-related sulfurtransferase